VLDLDTNLNIYLKYQFHLTVFIAIYRQEEAEADFVQKQFLAKYKAAVSFN